MICALAVGALSLFLVGLMFVPLERVFPARPGQPLLRPALHVDACFFFGQYLLFAHLAARAIDHSAEHLDWLAAFREHPLDGITTQVVINLPAILLGVRPDLFAIAAVFRGAWAIFVHSNVRLPLGPLAILFGAPELHHWHHARVDRTEHNFADLAPWLDVLFGTYYRPAPEERYRRRLATLC